MFIVAGGPSLIGFDFERIRQYTTITINRSHRYCRSDVICFVDAETGHDIKRVDGTLDLGPRIVASNYAGLTPGGRITTLRIGLNLNITDPSLPVYGPASSTLVAISIALIGGASHVFLLGVDCRFVRGEDHFHPHPVAQCRTDEAKYQRMAKAFDVFAPARDKIYNLSSVSTVRTFPRITIDHALRIADEDEHKRYNQPMPPVPRRP